MLLSWNDTRRDFGACSRLCKCFKPQFFMYSSSSLSNSQLTLSFGVVSSGAISVLAAPRVDYLSESVARRRAREKKIAEIRGLQDVFRTDPTATPTRSPHSSSSSPSSFVQPGASEPPSAQLSPPSYYTSHAALTFSQPPSAAFPLSRGGFDMNEFFSAGGQGDAMSSSMSSLAAGNDSLMVRPFSLNLISCLLLPFSVARLTDSPFRSDGFSQTLFPTSLQPPLPQQQQYPKLPYASYSPTGNHPYNPSSSNTAGYRLASTGIWNGLAQNGAGSGSQLAAGYGGDGSRSYSQGGDVGGSSSCS